MPALRQAEMASTERDLGPSVPTIFVMAGKKFWFPFAGGVWTGDQLGLGDPHTHAQISESGGGNGGRTYGLGWLEDGDHPDGLLEEQVGGMHLGSLGSDRRRGGDGGGAALLLLLLPQARQGKMLET
jgi:hypothetical protein